VPGPVQPPIGATGTAIVITGSGFGTKKGTVKIGTGLCRVSQWSDTSVACTLVKPLRAATYSVTIKAPKNAPIVFAQAFRVVPPDVTEVTPASGSAGTTVTIHGSYFGSQRGTVTLGGKACPIRSWTMNPATGASTASFVVPKSVKAGSQSLILKTKAKDATAPVSYPVN